MLPKLKSSLKCAKPVLGFVAYSGTGKTTLLCRLLPLLRQQGIRVAVIKHAHHDFDIDYPGKDSYELRKAGADQMLVASASRIAQVTELSTAESQEPNLQSLLQRIDTASCDLILVEGFKHESFPKIEINRSTHPKPLMFPSDESIIGLITDQNLSSYQTKPPIFSLGDDDAVLQFIKALMITSGEAGGGQ